MCDLPTGASEGMTKAGSARLCDSEPIISLHPRPLPGNTDACKFSTFCLNYQ